GHRKRGEVRVDAIVLVEGGGENAGADGPGRVPLPVSLQMVGFRADIGYFDHRVIHYLLLQAEVIAVLNRLPDRVDRIASERRWWRRARTQGWIKGETNRAGERCHRIPDIAECGEKRRVARRKIRVRIGKNVVIEDTESRPQNRLTARVES